jgi:DUF917 family protein
MAGAEPVAHAAGAALEAGAELYAVGVAGAVIASSARAAAPEIESRERVSREDFAVRVRMTGSPVVVSERIAASRRC